MIVATAAFPQVKAARSATVCETMLVAVERPFFIEAQQEFYEENKQRIRTKERLLHDGE